MPLCFSLLPYMSLVNPWKSNYMVELPPFSMADSSPFSLFGGDWGVLGNMVIWGNKVVNEYFRVSLKILIRKLQDFEQPYSVQVRRYCSPDEHPFFPTDLPDPLLPLLKFPQVLLLSINCIYIPKAQKDWIHYIAHDIHVYILDMTENLWKHQEDASHPTCMCSIIVFDRQTKLFVSVI